MNYYVIRPSLDKDIIGHYPQLKEVKHNCHVWDEPKFIQHLHFERANFKPITSNAILYSSSKLTDLIDTGGTMGFNKKLLVSTKLKNLLQANRSTGMQFFESPIIFKNNLVKDYWILNMYKINMHFVDFKNSIFVYRKRKPEGGTILENTKIQSFEDLKNKQSQKKQLGFTQLFIDKIRLLPEINEDFFTLLYVNGGVKYIASGKLKKEIENKGCTGLEFMPLEMKLTEWLQGGEREKVYGEVK